MENKALISIIRREIIFYAHIIVIWVYYRRAYRIIILLKKINLVIGTYHCALNRKVDYKYFELVHFVFEVFFTVYCHD